MRQVIGRASVLLSLAAAIILVGPGAGSEQIVIDLAIRGGQLPKEQQVIRVRQGDEVTLRWTTDRTLTIHLHGYDLEKKLKPEAPMTMRFTARATGRFPIETHGSRHGHEAILGYLEVHPR